MDWERFYYDEETREIVAKTFEKNQCYGITLVNDMIVFITSIKHPENSKSYETVWKLLEQTLVSVCNQRNKDFRVIVVCNEYLPIVNRNVKEQTDFLEVNFLSVPQDDYDGIQIDRGSKYAVGLIAAKKYSPHYIMFFDADDFLGDNISEYVNDRQENGWYIDKGFYLLDDKLKKKDEFYLRCGTSNIIRFNLICDLIPDELTIQDNREKLIDYIGEFSLKKILGAHKKPKNFFNLKPFPYRAAVRNCCTGENHSDVFGSSSFFKNDLVENSHEWTQINERQREYFGIR